MLIRAQLNWTVSGAEPQELGEFPADRLRIRSPDARFESLSSALLIVGHAALAAQFRVGERVQKVGVGANHQVEVTGIVLAVFEGFEAVGDQRLVQGCLLAILLLEEEAVSPEPRGLTADGLRGDLQLSSNLPESGTGDRAVEDRIEKVGTLEPIGGQKRLVAE